ncbi:MAG: hypothetical protein EZS28_028397 [Streblomastix strix]|uniref:Uncharacterized protein n=1 Tax=Streblomastix strix TaxID=222440 RepID=A0A5J4UZC2_9EUKA|nr:MAG: hypothetical protein EZS28_028397 [Streblomastix strix]
MSSERTWMVWNDEITDASAARDVLMDQQDRRKQETFFDMEHSSRDSSYRYSPQGGGATLELRTGEVLVAQYLLKREDAHWTSNQRETDVISSGLQYFEQQD